MTYRDRWVTDEGGRRYVFTVEMQRQLEALGLPVDPAYLGELSARQGSPTRRERAPERAPEPAAEEHAPQPPRGAVAEVAAPSHAGSEEAEADEMQPETIQIDPLTGKYVGRMKWYNPQRGYGFIARGGGEDIFFHKSDALVDPEEMVEGQWVLYDVEETSKGLEASEIEVYSGPE
ncbi:MAG: cold shock domain-containing protein [Ardenticatenales bacterium]|nr:cold shock domain-containing protein [Ardenticatenales bacterium]